MNPTDLESYSPEVSLDMSEFMTLNHDALRSITSLLDLASGFTIAFAECNFWQDGVALANAIADILDHDPELEPMQLEVWEFNEPRLRLLDELEKRLETLPRQEGKKLVLVLRGLENAIGVVGDYPRFLVDLNFVRDAYARMVPHPVVFVLPDYAITRVANFASDFWAWKSGVFKFQTLQKTRDFAEAKTIGSDRILGNYLKPERQERIDLLHRLLMEANPSGYKSSSNPNEASQINILNELGGAYESLSEFNQAIDFYDQALSIAKKLGDRKSEAVSLNNLGESYRNIGKYQQAIQLYQQALKFFRELGDRNSEAASLGNLGIAYKSLGQYQQAIQFQQQSLEIRREIGDCNGEANSLGNLGISYGSLGQYQQAIHFHQQSLEIFRKIGDRNGEASSLGNLGVSYNSLGQYQQAIQFFHQSLEITREIGDRNGEANTLGNLGIAYKSLGQYQQAIQFYQQSLEITREIGDRNGDAIALNNLGIAFKALGRRSESIEALNASKKIYEELGLYHKITGL